MKNILICVSGTSPAIITETYYWLAKNRPEPIIADELVIITTQQGKEKIIEDLLTPPNDRFVQMARMYGWPEDALKIENIKVPKNDNGEKINDVRTPQEFNFFANEVLNVVRRYTNDKKNNAVHASLAGGRKTMSYYLGLVMNIFGRKQDTLSHVLLDPEYERSAANFYYPGQSEPLKDRQGNSIDLPTIGDDIVQMSEFPIINLASGVNVERLRNSQYNFETILRVIKDEQEGVLRPIEVVGRRPFKVHFGAEVVELSPVELAFLLLLGYYAKSGKGKVITRRDEDNPSVVTSELKEVYLRYLLLQNFLKDCNLQNNEQDTKQSVNFDSNWKRQPPQSVSSNGEKEELKGLNNTTQLFFDSREFIDENWKQLKNLQRAEETLKAIEPTASRLYTKIEKVAKGYPQKQSNKPGVHYADPRILLEEYYNKIDELFDHHRFIYDIDVGTIDFRENEELERKERKEKEEKKRAAKQKK